MGKMFLNTVEDKRLEALCLWKTHAKNHRELIENYEALLTIKREMHLTLHPIKKHILIGYKPIPFFELEHEENAKAFLENLSLTQLSCLLYDLKNSTMIGSTYYAVQEWIKESKNQILIKESEKGHGYDPEYNKSYSPRPRAKRFQKKSICDFDEDR